MSLDRTLSEIRDDLVRWQQTGLNESQTIQAIVLPVLSELGWNQRNPFEIYPQKNSGGSAGGYIPDFTLVLNNQEKLLIEAKALGTNLSVHRAQAVNYANSVGHRWVALTNGMDWEILDNVLQVPAQDKLALTIETSDEKANIYLQELMSKAFWVQSNARELFAEHVERIKLDIRKRLRLSEIERKLRAEIQEGFTHDTRGLKRAIELTLEANERELANQQFDELKTRILVSLHSNPFNVSDVVAVLRECMNLVSQHSSRSSDFEAVIQGLSLNISSWRDFHTGIAEAFLKMNMSENLEQITRTYSTVTERLKENGETYPESAYRPLSNGRWLYIHLSARDHTRICNDLLKRLSIPTRLVEIRFNSENISLPV